MPKAPKPTGNSTPKTTYIPEWKHYASLYLLADLWTQFVQSKEYGDRNVRQIYLSWELPEIKHTFSEDKWPQSVVIWQVYSFSMGKKSKLRSVVESILGKPFKEDDAAYDYDVMGILWTTCKLNLVHNGDYVNIFSIIDQEKIETIKTELTPKEFFIDAFNQASFAALPEWLQEKIRLSPEYQEVAWDNPTETEADQLPF